MNKVTPIKRATNIDNPWLINKTQAIDKVSKSHRYANYIAYTQSGPLGPTTDTVTMEQNEIFEAIFNWRSIHAL